MNSGFSLIELMIVVAIIGILASVAYPAYTNSVLKGKRAEGRTALMELMQQQERFMTQNNSYCAFSNTAGTTAAVAGCTTVPFKTFSGDSDTKPAYYLSADACPPATTNATAMKECVRLNAQPVKSDPEAGTLQMLSTGTKTCTVLRLYGVLVMANYRIGLRGFTLIELMVTISMVVILMAIVVPSLSTFQRNAQLTSFANTMVASINAARGEAMKRGRYAMVVPKDGSSWSSGWVVLWISARLHHVPTKKPTM